MLLMACWEGISPFFAKCIVMHLDREIRYMHYDQTLTMGSPILTPATASAAAAVGSLLIAFQFRLSEVDY